eukprot:5914783-Amphidinium_carterae.1
MEAMEAVEAWERKRQRKGLRERKRWQGLGTESTHNNLGKAMEKEKEESTENSLTTTRGKQKERVVTTTTNDRKPTTTEGKDKGNGGKPQGPPLPTNYDWNKGKKGGKGKGGKRTDVVCYYVENLDIRATSVCGKDKFTS